MEIVYYPNLFIDDENLIKTIALFWGSVRTIIPPSHKSAIDDFLSGKCPNLTFYPAELYDKVNTELEYNVLDFLVIQDIERKRAAEKMLDVLTKWNVDTRFYDSIKINSIDDLIGKTVEWYWFLHEKLEHSLIELMLEEHIIVNWSPGEMVCYPEVGKSYMSVISNEIKNNRNIRLLTNDEYSLSSKSGVNLNKIDYAQNIEEGYQLISLAIPEIFIKPNSIKKLTWKDVKIIRKDLLPLSQEFYSEIEKYQSEINELYRNGKDDEAFNKFCEFCERVSASFQPFAKEVNSIIRKLSSQKFLSYTTGILLPTVKLLESKSELEKICDISAIALTVANYSFDKNKPIVGFEYLENLNRKIKVRGFKNTITCLTPTSLSKF